MHVISINPQDEARRIEEEDARYKECVQKTYAQLKAQEPHKSHYELMPIAEKLCMKCYRNIER